MLTDRTNSTNTETPTSINQKKRKEIEPRSWVWLNYASKTDKALAKCRICLKEITINKGSLSEVSKHLLKVHNITQNSIVPDKPSKRRYPKVKKLHQKLIKFIIACNLPFNITDSDDFQELIDAIKDEYYKLPCRQTLRYTLLPEMFTAMQNMLKLELNRLRFTYITTDVAIHLYHNRCITVHYYFNNRKFTYMNNENKSQALKVRAMDTVVRFYNQYIKPLLNSAPDVQTSVLDSDGSSSTPTSQIPSEQSPKKSRRDLGDTGFLSTISDIQPVNITESSVDFKFEFKYYELLNYNFSEKNTIYKTMCNTNLSTL
ncbi:zinc finger BED domain-containing 1-like [Brachionus plicatilis]|uniref:Zinc finger BED domain-containing 1-like n=1 Tax=Brachionus plicatilis TaxID=10195 RepID=A0A3M7SX18_BRAPC|nr:zinc finger BED domain-containing 1-like [Brachionus plicatilis]